MAEVYTRGRGPSRYRPWTLDPGPWTLDSVDLNTPHVVIIGGGFGGLFAAKALRRAPVRVTLVDRHNHHVFQPLLYQVATAGLSPGDIAAPIRWVLRHHDNVRVLLAEAQGDRPCGQARRSRPRRRARRTTI